MPKNNTSNRICDFYNQYPFPGYELDNYSSHEDLYRHANAYGKMLSDQIPENTKIYDIGCGTGRHACLLANKGREVIGIDFSSKSINKANELKDRCKLKNVTFFKKDIFDLSISNDADYILCIGVLHHIENHEKAFKNIIKILKPGGNIILGIYNTYGRLIIRLLKALHQINLYKPEKSDYFMRYIAKSEVEKDIWKQDMYHCPYEKNLSVGATLRLFKKHQLQYINAFPNKLAFCSGYSPLDEESLFESKKAGNFFDHFMVQFKWVFTEYKIGGLNMYIAKKLEDNHDRN